MIRHFLSFFHQPNTTFISSILKDVPMCYRTTRTILVFKRMRIKIISLY